MDRHRQLINRSHGFSLVEMAVVLVIIGLLLGGLLIPLTTQMENDRRKETQLTLAAVRDALVGFAQVNKFLPCPDANGDGLANDACTPGPPGNAGRAHQGGLPYASLGVSQFDAWGNPWIYVVNGAYTTDASLTLATAGTGAGIIEVRSGVACTGNRVADNVPALVRSGGKTSLDLTGSTLEQENVNGDRCFTDAVYVTGDTGFDDLLSWIPTGVFFNHMVTASAL